MSNIFTYRQLLPSHQTSLYVCVSKAGDRNPIEYRNQWLPSPIIVTKKLKNHRQQYCPHWDSSMWHTDGWSTWLSLSIGLGLGSFYVCHRWNTFVDEGRGIHSEANCWLQDVQGGYCSGQLLGWYSWLSPDVMYAKLACYTSISVCLTGMTVDSPNLFPLIHNCFLVAGIEQIPILTIHQYATLISPTQEQSISLGLQLILVNYRILCSHIHMTSVTVKCKIRHFFWEYTQSAPNAWWHVHNNIICLLLTPQPSPATPSSQPLSLWVWWSYSSSLVWLYWYLL